MMAYEAQIAGLGDAPPGRRVRASRDRDAASDAPRGARARAAPQRWPPSRRCSVPRGAAAALCQRRRHRQPRSCTARESAVTEIAAGSGLYGPTLFDAYTRLPARPAALFALPVVRKPSPAVATVLGGGYLASGPADAARLPPPFLPPGLASTSRREPGRCRHRCSAPPRDALRVGDRVWFRHAKAGELCERFDRLHLIEGDRIVEEVPTYRGEGKCFL